MKEHYAQMKISENSPNEIPQQTLSDRRKTAEGIGSTLEQFSIPDQLNAIGATSNHFVGKGVDAIKGAIGAITLYVAKKIQ